MVCLKLTSNISGLETSEEQGALWPCSHLQAVQAAWKCPAFPRDGADLQGWALVVKKICLGHVRCGAGGLWAELDAQCWCSAALQSPRAGRCWSESG